jgi:cell division protein FtsB
MRYQWNSNRPHLQTAIVTFVDNIAILAIENCLLCPLEHILTGKTVLSMDDQQIREIAAEPSNIQKDRERLNAELEKLRKARQTLNAFSTADSSLRARPILGMYIPYIGSWSHKLIGVSFQQG